MSGSHRRQKTTQPIDVVPFDLAVLQRGEAQALVTLDDGSMIAASLDTDWMVVPLGPPEKVSPIAAAAKARKGRHGLRVLLVGTSTGSDAEIIADLVDRGLMKAGDGDDPDRLRSIKKWRAEYRRWLVAAKSKGQS